MARRRTGLQCNTKIGFFQWYDGKPAAKDLPDPFGTIIIKKGDVRSGGSYWNWKFEDQRLDFIMQENDYLVKRWTEFLAA